MKRFAYLFLFTVLIFTLSTFTIKDGHAIGGTISDQTSCEAIGGTWPAFEECFVTNLTISSGEKVTVDAFVILVNMGIIENSGTIQVNGLGGIGNFGHIANTGTIYLKPQSELSNPVLFQSLITNQFTGTILNSGRITNFNVIGNDGTIVNNFLGTFTNTEFSVLYNDANIANSGNFINDGGIDNSGIFNNLCAIYSGNPPSGNPIAFFVCLDSDNDGIADGLDTVTFGFSNDFVDNDPAPITSGTITSRGDQIISINDGPDPEGVRIRSDPTSGGTSATIDVCSSTMTISLKAGDEIQVTCDSVDIHVFNGQIDITFTDGTTTGTSTLNAGDNIVFDPTSFSVTNNGSTPVIIILNGIHISITPGETFSNGESPKVVGGKMITIETTNLLLASAQSFSWTIPVVLSVLGIGMFVVLRKSEKP